MRRDIGTASGGDSWRKVAREVVEDSVLGQHFEATKVLICGLNLKLSLFYE